MTKARTANTPSSDLVLQTLAWMRKHDFKPVALHPQSKAAISRSYVDPDYKPPSDDMWRNNPHNIGLVTGPLQGGPVDIDLDCDEALFFAPIFLPRTPAVFGRPSKPRSHYLYKVEAETFTKFALNDPTLEGKSAATIIEARGDGGHQTVMPGSLHEGSGELIAWSDVALPEVPVISADELSRAVRKVALATLIVRHIWQPGYHNEPCKHLSGLFYYLDWTVEEAEQMIRAVCDYTGDKDKSRIPTVRSTYKRGEAGKKVSGAGVLRKQLKDDKLVDRLMEWAGSTTVNLIQQYNERWAVVAIGGKFRVADTDVRPGEAPEFYAKDDWMNIVGTDYVTIDEKPVLKGKLWLASPRRRSYGSVDFLPGVEDADQLNLWTGWAVEPQAGDCDGWIELVRDVICGGDKALYRWLVNWLANIVREPMHKSLTAPVIIGVEGAGKSLMLDYFGDILGPAYLSVTKEEHIVGRFNRHMGNTLLLHSEEALYGGDKKHAGIIRSLITDPWHMFEAKGIDAKKVRNYLRLVLTSNDLHAAPAKPGDRRYTVINIGERKAEQKLIDKVLAEKRGNGPAALFQALLDFKYDPALARTNVKNDDLLALKTINMQPVESWWYDTLMTGSMLPDFLHWAQRPEKEHWTECVSSTALHMSMALTLRARNVRHVPTPAYLAMQMDKFTRSKLMRVQREFSNPMLDEYPPEIKRMSARQNAIINLPPLEQCRKAFEQYMGQAFDWPAEDTEPKGEKADHDRY